MFIVIRGPELAIADFDNTLDIFKGKKSLYFTFDIIKINYYTIKIIFTSGIMGEFGLGGKSQGTPLYETLVA